MKKRREPVYHVESEQAGETLSAALRHWGAGASWSEVKKLVRSRRVTVNGNLCLDEARRLKEGEVVKVLAQSAPPLPKPEHVRVVYLDEHLVVVEKPPGITSNRHAEERNWPNRRRQFQPTLDEMLPEVIARTEGRRPKGGKGRLPPVRPVHRLDRDTGGLMVFARTVKAERGLMEQFRQHTTQRRYLAIAQGQVKPQTIETRLVRDRGDGRRGSTDKPNVGKRAVTHVKPIKRLDGYTLVECRLETGRTHQIRIHLAEQGHPLCGEKVYRRPLHGKPIPDRSGAPRIALHAASLGFQHPITGKKLFFESPLPKDLAELLDRLRAEKPKKQRATPSEKKPPKRHKDE